MSDRRSVHTDALATLGTILDESAKRDAIHLAVEPAIAGEELVAGSPIVLRDGKAWNCLASDAVGIVDPFLPRVVYSQMEPPLSVRPGERFWLVVLPRTITSLRHVWSHPAFPDAEVSAVAPPGKDEKRSQAEAWLRQYARELGIPYDYLLLSALEHQRLINSQEGPPLRGDLMEDEGDYLLIEGKDASGPIESEFWDRVQAVTGTAMLVRARYFTCMC